MLVAGCMNSNDTAYSILADVHVPACASQWITRSAASPPGAANFDPLARQVANTSSAPEGALHAAVNYNSDATLEDPNEPCIEARVGCTVNSNHLSP